MFLISIAINLISSVVDNVMFIVYAVLFGEKQSVEPLAMILISIPLMLTGVLSLLWCVKTYVFELRWL